ncbi:hypothetical protein GW17_00003059 [Ensete ventricosum]|nr:hypothetical protein GW17_00003059 [Ensete ventricosum]
MKVFLQKFEPGYTIPEKKALIDVGVTIRDWNSHPSPSPPLVNNRICSQLMMILLMRNLIAVITVGADHYAVTILTVRTALTQILCFSSGFVVDLPVMAYAAGVPAES